MNQTPAWGTLGLIVVEEVTLAMLGSPWSPRALESCPWQGASQVRAEFPVQGPAAQHAGACVPRQLSSCPCPLFLWPATWLTVCPALKVDCKARLVVLLAVILEETCSVAGEHKGFLLTIARVWERGTSLGAWLLLHCGGW